MNGPVVIGLMIWFLGLGFWAGWTLARTPKTGPTFAEQMGALRRATGRAGEEIVKGLPGVPAKWRDKGDRWDS